MQAKVRELEEKCRTQSEQFNLLSRELERFRQQAGKIDLLSSNVVVSSDIPGSPGKSLSQLMNGIATSIGKGKDQHFICGCLFCLVGFKMQFSDVNRVLLHKCKIEFAPVSVLLTCLDFRVSLKPSLRLFLFYLSTAVSRIL